MHYPRQSKHPGLEHIDKYFDIPEQYGLAYDLFGEKPVVDIFEGSDEGGLPIPRDMLRALHAVANWQVSPPFPKNGRNSYLPLRESLKTEGWPDVHCVQIKGLGIRTNGIVQPPRTDTVHHPEGFNFGFQMTVDEEGNLHPLFATDEAFGGLSLEGAKREFFNSQRLLQAGIATYVPVRYGEIDNLEWKKEPLGIAVMALTRPDLMIRFSDLLNSGRYVKFGITETVDAILRELGYEATGGPEDMTAIHELLVGPFNLQKGKTLRRIHEDAGLVDVQSHAGNFGYNYQSGDIMTYDLESLQDITKMPERARGMWMLHDIVRSLNFDILAMIDVQIKSIDLIGQAPILSPEVLYNLLYGYFYQEAEHDEGFRAQIQTLAKEILRLIDRWVSEKLFAPDRSLIEEKQRNSFYSTLCSMVLPLYQSSGLNKKYPIPDTPEQIRGKFLAYKKEAELFERTCRENEALAIEIMNPRTTRARIAAILKGIAQA